MIYIERLNTFLRRRKLRVKAATKELPDWDSLEFLCISLNRFSKVCLLQSEIHVWDGCLSLKFNKLKERLPHESLLRLYSGPGCSMCSSPTPTSPDGVENLCSTLRVWSCQSHHRFCSVARDDAAGAQSGSRCVQADQNSAENVVAKSLIVDIAMDLHKSLWNLYNIV